MPITYTYSISDVSGATLLFYRDNDNNICVRATFPGMPIGSEATLASLVADGVITGAQRTALLNVLQDIRLALRNSANLQP